MGIALYVMLSGSAPFDQSLPVAKLLKQVCAGNLKMSTPDWRHISTHAKVARRDSNAGSRGRSGR